MKKYSLIILVSAMTLFAAACSSNQNKTDTKSSNQSEIADNTYTCPMHPEVVKEEPGACPKCGMDLEIVDENPDSTNVPMRDSI